MYTYREGAEENEREGERERKAPTSNIQTTYSNKLFNVCTLLATWETRYFACTKTFDSFWINIHFILYWSLELSGKTLFATYLTYIL